MAEGIEVRHGKQCRSHDGRRCNCQPSYRAHVYNKRTGKLIRKTHNSERDAKLWRAEALGAVERGALVQRTRLTVNDALDTLITGMRDGTVLDRSGKPYKPATIRRYKQAADKYLRKPLGGRRLSDVHRRDVQALVERLRAQGLSPSSVRNVLDPLRVMFRRAVRDDVVNIDPTDALELPAIRSRRPVVRAPERAHGLVAALPNDERALLVGAAVLRP